MGHAKKRGGQRGDVGGWSLKRQKSKPGVRPRTARTDGKMAREMAKVQGRNAVSEMLEDVGAGTQAVPD